MITKLENISQLSHFNDFLSVKIRSLFLAYGSEFDFCDFYIQKNEEANITAFLSRYYSSVSLVYNAECDLKEIIDFIYLLSPSELICDFSFSENFNAGKRKVFSVKKDCSFSKNTNVEFCFSTGWEIYRLFSQGDKDIEVGNFENWYANINHFYRHGFARTYFNKECAAVVLTDHENHYLNGIAVNKTNRSKGYGSAFLKGILSDFNNGFLIALCSDDVLPFYLKNGFKIDREYAIINF